MGTPRNLGAQLLRAALRLAPEESREWALAMIRELEFIENDWAALFWAMGSAAAILRHAVNGWRSCMKHKAEEDTRMNDKGKKALGVGIGLLSSLMLVGCAFALLRIAALLFPGLGIDRLEWTHWLTVIVIPEAIFVTAAALLWRKKGPVAAGILTTALVVGLHVAVHLASR
jgi:hypothetical protein